MNMLFKGTAISGLLCLSMASMVAHAKPPEAEAPSGTLILVAGASQKCSIFNRQLIVDDFGNDSLNLFHKERGFAQVPMLFAKSDIEEHPGSVK
jgi:hypothetical protein